MTGPSAAPGGVDAPGRLIPGRLIPGRLIEVPAGHVASVVTYLEMTEPPAAPASDLPAGWSIDRVDRPDVRWYRRLFAHIGADWLWFSRLVMPEAALARLLADPAIEVTVLTVDGEAVGLAELDRRQPQEVELAFFGLAPDWVGRGAGGRLMAAALQRAWRPGPRRVWVHTCTLDHPRALGFYRHAGFRPYRQAVEIAPDPRLAGALPETAAPQIPVFRP
jgi:GNAT superfamily N-acetyltransferase